MAANQRVKNVPNVPEDDEIDGDFLAEGAAEEAAALARKAEEGEGANDAERISGQALTNVNAKLARSKALASQQGKPYQAPTDDEREKLIEKEMDRLAAKEENAKKKRAFRKAEEDAGKGSGGHAGDEWARDWFFLTRSNTFIKPGMRDSISQIGINAVYAELVPSDSKTTAFGYIQGNTRFKQAYDVSYAAGLEPVFEYKGRTFINSYRADQTPIAAKEYTDEGWSAVLTIRAHLRNLFEKEKDAAMVESWIALNVRNPGKLLGVCLLVKGAQGDGKTVIFREMMGQLMGDSNVGTVGRNEIASDFSGWAIGSAVCVAEELKTPGKNRYAITEAMQTFITNKEARVTKKGQDGVSYINSTNYCGLTNHADALPIDNADRRWWILFTRFLNRDEFAATVKDPYRYFTRVRSAIFDHADALRKFFLECEIHPDVFHGMQAPETDGRRAMLSTDSNAIGGDHLDAYIADSLEEPPKWRTGVSSEVIAVGELSEWLKEDMGRDDMPQSRQLNRLLTSRGYHQCEKTIRWNGRLFRVYVKDKSLIPATIANRDAIKVLLDKTAVCLESVGGNKQTAIEHGGF